MRHGCVSVCMLGREYNHLRATQGVELRKDLLIFTFSPIHPLACLQLERGAALLFAFQPAFTKALIGMTREGLDKFF